jgi:heme-degrading monooxygenase HmoA
MHHGDSPGEYVIVWRYEVAEEAREAFEQAYGPHGPWVALFATAPGYRRTDFVRGEGLGEYLTIDRWESRELYDTFRSARALDYKAARRRVRRTDRDGDDGLRRDRDRSVAAVGVHDRRMPMITGRER